MSIFGAQPQTSAFGQSTTGTSVFGQPAASATGNSGSSIFGQTLGNPQQPQNQQQTNAFGTSSLFGQPQAQQQQQNQQAQQPAASFMNASQQTIRPSLIWEEGRDTPSNQKPVTEQCQAIYEKWNPNSPNTAFKYYFYNKVDQSRVPFFQPGPREDPREWEQAVHDKPAPGYMPALATGFAAIAQRLMMQRDFLAAYNTRLHEINQCLDAILSRHDLETSVRAANARRKHTILRQRCLALASKVQVLRNRGYALDADEDDLKSKLEAVDRGMSDPALSARAEELWSRLGQLRQYSDALRNEMNQRGNDNGEGIPEEAEAKAKKLLEDYDKQLQALKAMVEKVKDDYEEWEKEKAPAATSSKK